MNTNDDYLPSSSFHPGNKLRLSLPFRSHTSMDVVEPRMTSASRLKKQSDYQPMFSVKDPHMQFYNQCRSRDKAKEIQGPLRMKLVSSYDRIKSEMEVRNAVPGTVAHQNWDVVPVIRRSSNF